MYTYATHMHVLRMYHTLSTVCFNPNSTQILIQIPYVFRLNSIQIEDPNSLGFASKSVPGPNESVAAVADAARRAREAPPQVVLKAQWASRLQVYSGRTLVAKPTPFPADPLTIYHS